jgi:hypothetical protein
MREFGSTFPKPDLKGSRPLLFILNDLEPTPSKDPATINANTQSPIEIIHRLVLAAANQ